MLPSKASKKLTLGMTGVYAQQRWDNNNNNDDDNNNNNDDDDDETSWG